MKVAFKRYFLEISYRGTNYHGWQVQDNAVTVQSILQDCLSTLLQREVMTTGAGRTDTGVHARQLFVHIDMQDLDINRGKERFLYALNSLLPKDIAINNIHEVSADAHARFDAIERSYEYRMHFTKNPFLEGLSCYQRYRPNVDKMNEAALYLLGQKDFTCFSKAHTQVFTNICEIIQAEWQWEGEQLVFHITANRFLRNMVRAIVGTLLDVGIKEKEPIHILQVIEGMDRSKAGVSVPAAGLYLTQVKYPYL